MNELEGWHFLAKDIGRQGTVHKHLGDNYFLVHVNSWIDGGSNTSEIYHINNMLSWQFFKSPEAWREAGDNFSRTWKD